MPLVVLLLLLGLLAGLGWLARARRLRSERRMRIHDVLLQVNVSGDTFEPETLDGLPVPAVQYLRKALAPRAPLARSVDIRMTGSLRVAADDWVPFEARQRVCAERGFVWEARVAAFRKLWVCGGDWLFGEDAAIEHALAGWWPIIERRGPEVARSAAGRLMTELVWLPSALTPQRGARWARGDADRAVVTPAGSAIPMTVVVAEDGTLREVSVLRRRLAHNGEISLATYGASIEAVEQFGDFLVPTRLVAAWGIGTDDREDFMRVTVDDLRWL
jgi:hypothetical protein